MRPYMTEEEAMAKKCCPFRQWPDGEAKACLGSNCMCWGTSDDLARVDRRGITPLGRCEAPGGAA